MLRHDYEKRSVLVVCLLVPVRIGCRDVLELSRTAAGHTLVALVKDGGTIQRHNGQPRKNRLVRVVSLLRPDCDSHCCFPSIFRASAGH